MTKRRHEPVRFGYRYLTMFQRSHATVMARVTEHSMDQIAISVVTVEEQLSGWYAQLRKAKSPERLAWAYRRLADSVRFLARVRILDFEIAAIRRYEELKRLKVGKMDLQIAATALEHAGTVVTRNVRDFQQVPGLGIEDWSK